MEVGIALPFVTLSVAKGLSFVTLSHPIRHPERSEGSFFRHPKPSDSSP